MASLTVGHTELRVVPELGRALVDAVPRGQVAQVVKGDFVLGFDPSLCFG